MQISYKAIWVCILWSVCLVALATVDPNAPKTLQSSITALPVWTNASVSNAVRGIIMQVQAGAGFGYLCLYIFPQLVNAVLLVATFLNEHNTQHQRVAYTLLHIVLAYYLYSLPMSLYVYSSFVFYVVTLVLLFIVLLRRCFQPRMPRKFFMFVQALGFLEILYLAMVVRLMIYWFSATT